MAQSPACGDMAQCCLSHRPPVATLPPPHPPSRCVFLEMLWLRRSLASILYLHTWGFFVFLVFVGALMYTAFNFCLTILLLYCFFRRVTAWERSWQRWRPSEISCVGRWTLFRNTLMAVLTLCLKMNCREIKVRPPVLLLMSKYRIFLKII